MEEALQIVKENAKAKFDESVEVHIRLGIDPKKGEQTVRGSVDFKYGTGKTKKIAVFTQSRADDALKAGAFAAGGEDLIKQIKTTGKCDFDIAVAEPEMMKSLAQVAKILGPKGLMPTPKNETVVSDVVKALESLKRGRVTFKNDDSGNIHQIIGKVSFEVEKLKDNLNTFLDAVKRAKPSGVKGVYIKAVSICSTMSQSVLIQD
jgi:large subunit ribosomal protein L1